MDFPTQEHIKAAQGAARSVQAKTGFYAWPSIALVQAKWESAGWTKLSGKNNGFGIKATPAEIKAGKATLRRTREVIGGKDVYIDAYFADYASIRDAYEAHAMLFTRVGVYKPALTAPNAEAFLRLIAPHYATDPTYFAKLSADARAMGVYKYDEPKALPKAKAQGAAGAAVVVAASAVGAGAAHGWVLAGVVGVAALAAAALAFAHAAKAEKFNGQEA